MMSYRNDEGVVRTHVTKNPILPCSAPPPASTVHLDLRKKTLDVSMTARSEEPNVE